MTAVDPGSRRPVHIGGDAPAGDGSGAAAPVPRRRQATLRSALRQTRTRVGLTLFGAVVAIAVVGPLVAPHRPTEFVARPNSGPSAVAVFGADELGRDVLSRFLCGGLTVLWPAVAATVLGVVLGTAVGLTAAYGRGWVDDLLMRLSDVVLAFPSVVLALLVVSALGPNPWLIVACVGLTHAPRVARVIHGAAREVVARDFVEDAEVVGEPRWRIVCGELLPNVTSPLLVELGLRMTYSIGLIAAISFVGFGQQPPTADWGLIINENRLSIIIQPWSVLLPVLAIAALTIGTNLVTDGIARVSIGIDRGGRR